jgi:diguanylate cyclase (GGDEF)-like protein
VWFGVNLIHLVGPPVLLWVPSPLAGAVLTAVYVRTSRLSSLAPAVRRFWRHMSLTAALVGTASTAQAVDVLSHPFSGGPHTGVVMMSFDGFAIMVIVYALYRLPMAQQTAGEAVRIALDAGTVMLATAVFIWHFQTRAAIGTNDRNQVVASLLVTVLALAAVLAVAKVVMSSYSFIDKTALRLFAFAMCVGSVGPMTQDLLGSRPYLVATQVSIPAVFFLAALAGDRQRRTSQAPARGAKETKRRPFSLLPYVAVVAVDALLVAVIRSGDDAEVVAGAVVLITALVVLRQVTAFRDNGRLLARLDHGATHDALTQLPNRALFAQRLHNALTTPGHRPVTVALIDLDDFKEVNDTLGHEIGDLLLITVAQRLTACIRAEDTVARLGGDEFVIVLDNADPTAADLAAERITTALHQPITADGHELPIHASIGIADGHTGDEPSLLLRRADIAMYQAKTIPGTAHLHYHHDMATTATDHAHLTTELRTAITNNHLHLLYQPITDLHTGHLTGAEALIRWHHPHRGTLTPDTFIPLAERTGLITTITHWVITEACRQLAAWSTQHGTHAPPTININISARDLREPGFATTVTDILSTHHLTPDRIVLEITETTALQPGTSHTNLHHLRAAGIRISLDDFGTGHSTLTLLHDCPIDEIKLDRTFVHAHHDDRPPIAAAVIHLAQALGLHTVAEGVETPEQAHMLQNLGYTAAQGYLFARPMPPTEFEELLLEPRSLSPDAAAADASAPV